MPIRKLPLCALLALATALPAVAQGNAPAPAPQSPPATAANAESLFQSGNWEKSVAANEAVVKAEPANGRAWFRLGLSQLALKHYDAAATALDKAEANGFKSPYLGFGRATIAASRHQKDQALDALDKAVAAGFADSHMLAMDDSWKAFAGDPRYKQLVERIERPCEADPAYHKMDFWVGHWDVFSGSDKDGTNVVEKTLNGCAIIENWKDVEGHEGKSLFYYNPVTGKRKQVWVTDIGPLKEKVEVDAPEKGAVRFQGELPQRGGGVVFDRTTLTPLPGDRVRQVIEQSRDGGKTWVVGYDAVYVRQKG